jgi:hypothetical protein
MRQKETLARHLLTGVFVVLAVVTCLAAFLLFVGVWGLIASDGEADPSWRWGTYLLTMAAIAAVFLVGGSLTVLVHRLRERASRSRQAA